MIIHCKHVQTMYPSIPEQWSPAPVSSVQPSVDLRVMEVCLVLKRPAHGAAERSVESDVRSSGAPAAKKRSSKLEQELLWAMGLRGAL